MRKDIFRVVMALALCIISATSFAQSKVNKQNLVINEWKQDLKTGAKYLDHTTTYSADGKKLEEVEYNLKGQKWRKRYEYDAGGKLHQELIYNERNKLTYVKKMEYNEHGRKKTQTTLNASGKTVSIKTYEYTTKK